MITTRDFVLRDPLAAPIREILLLAIGGDKAKYPGCLRQQPPAMNEVGTGVWWSFVSTLNPARMTETMIVNMIEKPVRHAAFLAVDEYVTAHRPIWIATEPCLRWNIDPTPGTHDWLLEILQRRHAALDGAELSMMDECAQRLVRLEEALSCTSTTSS